MSEEFNESDSLTVTAEDKQALLDVIVEITHQLNIQHESKETVKDIAAAAEDTFSIKKKYITRMAKVMYAKSFKDVQEESSHFEALYEMVVGERGGQYAKD